MARSARDEPIGMKFAKTSQSCIDAIRNGVRWLLMLGVIFAQSLVFAADVPAVGTLSSAIKESAQLITVVEPHLSSPEVQTRVQYRGWQADAVLDHLLGSDWRKPGADVEFRALDGYISRIPVERFSQYRAYLVFERVGHKDFSVDNLAQNQKQVPLGPYYLIWDNSADPALIAEGGTFWPYQVNVIQLSMARQQAMLPPGMPAGNWSKAAALTHKYCLSCHQVNSFGGLKWPGNLAEQARKKSLAEFTRWTSNPSAVKPGTNMPGLPLALSDIQRTEIAREIYNYLSAVPLAPQAPATQSKLLMRTQSSWDGIPLNFKAGPGEVSAMLVEIAPHGQTGWHQHPVANFAYVLEGEIEVSLKDGRINRVKAGEALAEVVQVMHNGRNPSPTQVAKLVVFYVGGIGLPVTIPEAAPKN